MDKIQKNIKVSLVIVGISGLIVGYALGAGGRGEHGYGRGYDRQHARGSENGSMGGMMRGGMMGDDNEYGMDEAGTSKMNMMMDMMTANLQGKTGDAFDKAFLADMIPHHQGAVEMAQMVLETSKRPELLQLAQGIIDAQNKEIEMMQGWQESLFENAQ